TIFLFFFFSSRRRHTRFSRDWSSDVCSSDLKQVSIALRFYGNSSIDKWMVTVKLDQDYLSNGYAVPAEQSALTFNSQSINSGNRSEEHTSELQSRENLVCRLLLEKKKK